MEDRIRALVQPIADELGVEVLKVSLGGSAKPLLKVIVDRAGGVDCEALERISRGLALQLDAADMIAAAYRLEVTSPGFDWPLQHPSDLARHRGEWVKVSLRDGTTLEGTNLGPDADGLSVQMDDGSERKLLLDEVAKIVRAINWKAVSRRS